MSAYVVSQKHINTLLTYANRQRFAPRVTLSNGDVLYFDQLGDLQAAAEILLGENIRSVQARYPDTRTSPGNMPGVITEVGMPIIFNFETMPRKPVEILKACDCFDYQACETDDYEQTDAHRIIDIIRKSAIHNLAGYEDAKWSID